MRFFRHSKYIISDLKKIPMKNFLPITLLTLLFASFSWANPTDARKNFKQWIASERLISKELSDWEIQKAAIGDLIELLEEEEKSINENLAALENEIPLEKKSGFALAINMKI